MRIIAVDPGTTESGFCVLHDGQLIASGVMDNSSMPTHIRAWALEKDAFAVEMVASYGMPVGREVFETCVWIGRFQQCWRSPEAVWLVYRRDVKMHLCHTAKAKDANIRQALIDRFGPGKEAAIGTKAKPGPLYGVKSHAWPALAVAVTIHDQIAAQNGARAA